MTFAATVFYFFAALTIVSGLFVLFTRNVMYAGFSLLCTFLGIAAMYVFAGADFLAVAQIMIYVGGILVLILFGIMLANRVAGNTFIVSESRNKFAGLLGGGGLFIILISGIFRARFDDLSWIQNSMKMEQMSKTTLGTIGENMMTDYVLPFELAGLILMVALMGATFIASQVVKK